MGVASFDLSAKVSAVAVSSYKQWWNNCFEPTVDISKKYIADQSDTPLLHVSRLPLAPETVLQLSPEKNRQEILVRAYDIDSFVNQPRSKAHIVIQGNSYESFSSDFLFTNKFVNNQPLFWVDELPLAATAHSISVVDRLGKPIRDGVFATAVENNPDSNLPARLLVQHSLEASGTNHYTVYYQTGLRTVLHKTLNQSSLFHRAGTWEVGTSGTGSLDGHFGYSISTSVAGYIFELPASEKIAIKPARGGYLRAEVPKSVLPIESWHAYIPRVTIRGASSLYHFPEWEQQLFIDAGHTYVYNDYAAPLDLSTLQVSYPCPQTSIVGHKIYIQEIDQDDNVVGGITNDISLRYKSIGTWSAKWTTDNLNVVHQAGLITTKYPLNANYFYAASYPCLSEGFVFTQKDLNPWRQPSLRGSRVVLYTVPKTTANPFQDRSVEYVVCDEDGLITYCSQKERNCKNPPISATGQAYEFLIPTANGATPNSLPLVAYLGTSFVYQHCLGGGGTGQYLILGEFDIPERLAEQSVTLLTDARRTAGMGTNIPTAMGRNPYAAFASRETQDPNNMRLPIAGAMVCLTDEDVTAALVTEKMALCGPGGLKAVLKPRLVPDLRVKEFSVLDTSITIGWNRVPYSGTVPIGGILLHGTQTSEMTACGTEMDLFVKTSTRMDMTTSTEIDYFSMKAFYVDSNDDTQYHGTSNIISFCFNFQS